MTKTKRYTDAKGNTFNYSPDAAAKLGFDPDSGKDAPVYTPPADGEEIYGGRIVSSASAKGDATTSTDAPVAETVKDEPVDEDTKAKNKARSTEKN